MSRCTPLLIQVTAWAVAILPIITPADSAAQSRQKATRYLARSSDEASDAVTRRVADDAPPNSLRLLQAASHTDTRGLSADDYVTTAFDRVSANESESFDVTGESTEGCDACCPPSDGCGANQCDACYKSGSGKAAGPPKPYKGLYYDNDFSYVDRLGVRHPSEIFKRVPATSNVTVDVGGEYRMRYHSEKNIGRSRLDGLDNEFLLQRTRLYTNVEVGELFRAYVEMIDGTSSHENLLPRSTEENRTDFINIFGDVRLWDDGAGGSLTGRVGRQELLYGAQRLISPLDWSNTRRTFDGAKMFYSGGDWKLDAFWLRPVSASQRVNNDHNFDRPDLSREFIGAYLTNTGTENQTYDFYFLRLAEYDATGTAANPVDFNANLFGGRWLGRSGDWLWEAEGGYQFGDFGALDQSAGFYTLGIGHVFSQLPWSPTLWSYYDWASGDSDPTDGDRGTFNQLFPLGHQHLGFMDVVGRQNIEAWNWAATVQPHEKLSLLFRWYIFHLDESRDALYNAGGGAIRADPTGASGTDVGEEIDLLVRYQFNARADVLFGYSHFYSGAFVANTGPAADADFYYTQMSYRF